MAPQYPCIQCSSSNFYEDDGIWYCHNGHEQEGGQQIGEDATDHGKGGRIKRAKEVREKQKIIKIYRGAKGIELYLKAWQYILWRQCYALIHSHGLPSELWALVRELWTLRLSLLTPRLEESLDTDPDEVTEYSTTSESGRDTEEDQAVKILKTSKHAKDNPTLPDTISLVYVAVMILRYPLRLSTLHDYVRHEKVCYIRAIRYVPSDIRDRLAPEYHANLDTTAVPTQYELQFAVYRTAVMYAMDFDMIIPPLNWTLILFENVKRLALPLEIYPAAKFLASILQYDFTYPRRHARRNATTYPEVQIMALIVVATKLLYPFDTKTAKQYPQSANEPAALRINWQTWLDAKTTHDKTMQPSGLSAKDAIEVTDADILQMPKDRLDQYMDWFQQTYAKDPKTNNLYSEILDMFPLQTIVNSEGNDDDFQHDQRHVLARVQATQAELKPRRTMGESDETTDAEVILRPGQRYQQYLSVESMPEVVLHFHREAAELACLGIDALLRACLRTERLLLLYQHEQRRSDYFQDEEDAQSE